MTIIGTAFATVVILCLPSVRCLCNTGRPTVLALPVYTVCMPYVYSLIQDIEVYSFSLLLPPFSYGNPMVVASSHFKAKINLIEKGIPAIFLSSAQLDKQAESYDLQEMGGTNHFCYT